MRKRLLKFLLINTNGSKMIAISLLLFITLQSSAASTITGTQEAKISISLKNATLSDVLSEIEQKSGYHVFFNSDQNTVLKNISIDATNKSVALILNDIFKDTNLTYKFTNNKTIIVSQQEKITAKGIVVDKLSKKPIVGATVIVKGTSNGAITDDKGIFTLSVKDGDELEASYMGMKQATIKVTKTNVGNIILSMEADAMALDDVVVVGYGTTRKKDLTGAVASFDTKVIEESTATSLAHMMQGQVAGLSVLTGTGAPGSPSRLEIRGVPSLSGSTTPLIVVDNVPMADGFDINELNPDDVKSVDILKGASSAAIYGSRAASGVIMITTKFGQRNSKPEINYSYDYGLTNLVSPVRTLTSSEYKMLLMEGVANSAMSAGYEDINQYPIYKTITAEGYFGESTTPWMNYLMQNGTRQQHKLSVRGGSEHIGYTGSFGYTDEVGQMKSSSFQRYTYDLGFNSDINKFIKASVKVSGVMSNQLSGGINLQQAASVRPDIKAYNDDGSLYLHSYMSGSSVYYINNPIIELTENTTKVDNNNIRLTGNVEVSILPELKFFTQYTYQYRKGESNNYLSSRTQAGSNFRGGQKGESRFGINNAKNTEFEARLNYNKVFNKHQISAVAAITYTDDETSYFRLQMKDFADDKIQNAIWQGANYKSKSGGAVGSVLLSYVARAEYKFMDRYLLTATVRSDGSSRFSPQYRWGTFPSVAAAWIITEEKFMEGVSSWLPFLKLRGGWGKAGNGYVGEYGWRTLYESSDYQGSPSIIPSQLGNDELRWESTKQIDLGLDFAFLKNQRIRGSLGFYQKETSGLLYPLTLAPSTGLSSTNVNFANIQNKGVEFEMTADIINNKKLVWTAGFNIGKNLNKITGLDARYISYLGSPSLGRTVIEEGRSLGLIYGFRTDGIFQSWEEIARYEALNPNFQYQEAYAYRKTMPGDVKCVDLNGDGYVNKTWNQNEDKEVIGCSRPDFEGGFNTRLVWNGFTLSMQATFSYGAQKIWDGEATAFNMSTTANNSEIALKRWTPQNKQNKYPSVRYSYFYNDFTDFSVYDASYFKIQNINLEYRLPQHLVNKTKIFGNISVFGSINNVHTFTSYPGPNPESFSTDAIAGASSDASVYPLTRTFNFGIKITIK